MRKKLFTFLLALVTSVGMSWATDPIVIPTNTEQSSYTQGDITITCSKPGDFSGFYLDKSENETATITNSGSSTISQIVLGIGWFPDDRSYVRANGAEPTNSSDPYSITFSNVNSNNVTLTITNGKIQISDVTITLADEGGSASSVTAARFVYNYDCQRSPAYPQAGSPCNLSGFSDPLVGYTGIGIRNKALGPWKLEFVGYYTPSNHYGCEYRVISAVNSYYPTLSDGEKEAKCLEVPIFRLWQYNLAAKEYQHASYGIICAYAGEANAQDHGALFISSESWGCFLTGHQHTSSFQISCENDLTTGMADLVAAASINDPELDAIQPIIVSIDAIGTVELTQFCKDQIEGSRAAYNALTDEQKAQITNYSTLVDAEAQWAALAAAAQPYADAVISLINAIPDPVVYTQDCKDKIDAAQAAYDALTDGQKILVTNADKLPQAHLDYINAAPSVNIVFRADNSNIKKVEDVTLPRAFATGDASSEMVSILKELYNLDEEYTMGYASSNSDAVVISNSWSNKSWTVSPFDGTARVTGSLSKVGSWGPQSFTVYISLELPPFGPAPTPTPSGDKLPGAFSVDASKVIYFSKGNLQYTGSWQFAANQWDVIGASQTDDNRDLFSWGTGDAPNWENNMGGDWRTLTKDEWKYLFLTRDNAATLFALGRVNDKKGVILLPDAWVLPDGASFNASSENGFEKMGSTYYDDDYTNDHFQDNTYTTEQWAVMESAGAVFLPAAGYRESSNSNIYYVGDMGYYWSATPNDDEAYYISFSSEYLGTQNYNTRNDGRSVRLVSETAPTPTPTDEQVPTNVDPDNSSYHYSTFFHSTQNYKLSNDGTQAFIADLSNNELVLTEIAHGEQVIPANTAVILRKTGSADPVVLVPTAENGVSINPEDNDLRGVDEATTLASLSINPLQCYVLSGKSHDETESGVGFYRIYGPTLKAHKAYVIFAGGSNNAPKKMRFVYGQATGIEDVQGNNVQSTKVIENGVLYIIRDGKTYNAMGQMVK